MPDPARQASLEPTFTDDQVAATLHKSPRWLRKFAAGVPGLDVMRAGRTMLFTRHDVELIKAAIRCQSTSAAGAAKFGTRAARSASARKRSGSASSAQAAVRELLQKARQERGTRRSARPSLTVLPGGLTRSP